MNPFVVAIIATYRRLRELERLLVSFEKVTAPLAVLIVDNAGDAGMEPLLKAIREAQPQLEIVRVVPGTNLGCGAGLAFGERAALKQFATRVTHLWTMDDDAVIHPGALEKMLAAMQASGAPVACPMIVTGEGKIGWCPGLLEKRALKAIRTLDSPAEFIARIGSDPLPFSWATGVSVLCSREALEQFGFHRGDFWIRGEDLEFSLRMTARCPGVFVPDAIVGHIPPPVSSTPEVSGDEREKQGAMLQNVAYISFHLPHGRRIMRNLPGNLWRFVKLWGPGSLPQALRFYWRGCIRATPAGAELTAIQQ